MISGGDVARSLQRPLLQSESQQPVVAVAATALPNGLRIMGAM